MFVDVVKQRADLLIDTEGDIHLFLTINTETMTDIIICRKTYGQNVGVIVGAKFFIRNCFFSKRDQQIVREWRVIQSFVEEPAR